VLESLPGFVVPKFTANTTLADNFRSSYFASLPDLMIASLFSFPLSSGLSCFCSLLCLGQASAVPKDICFLPLEYHFSADSSGFAFPFPPPSCFSPCAREIHLIPLVKHPRRLFLVSGLSFLVNNPLSRDSPVLLFAVLNPHFLTAFTGSFSH